MYSASIVYQGKASSSRACSTLTTFSCNRSLFRVISHALRYLSKSSDTSEIFNRKFEGNIVDPEVLELLECGFYDLFA